ncbi:hypothetical protein THAOC_37652, partial [Thalassiosira oceanica]
PFENPFVPRDLADRQGVQPAGGACSTNPLDSRAVARDSRQLETNGLDTGGSSAEELDIIPPSLLSEFKERSAVPTDRPPSTFTAPGMVLSWSCLAVSPYYSEESGGRYVSSAGPPVVPSSGPRELSTNTAKRPRSPSSTISSGEKSDTRCTKILFGLPFCESGKIRYLEHHHGRRSGGPLVGRHNRRRGSEHRPGQGRPAFGRLRGGRHRRHPQARKDEPEAHAQRHEQERRGRRRQAQGGLRPLHERDREAGEEVGHDRVEHDRRQGAGAPLPSSQDAALGAGGDGVGRVGVQGDGQGGQRSGQHP